MDTRTNWDRAYEEGFVTHLNELGVPLAAYQGLARSRNLLRSMARVSCMGIEELFIQRQ